MKEIYTFERMPVRSSEGLDRDDYARGMRSKYTALLGRLECSKFLHSLWLRPAMGIYVLKALASSPALSWKSSPSGMAQEGTGKVF